MLNQTDLERERYESRRKAQFDENTRLKVAALAIAEAEERGLAKGLEKGLEEGLEKGGPIGAIQLCQQLLGRPVTPSKQLAGLSLEALSKMAEDLKELIRNR